MQWAVALLFAACAQGVGAAVSADDVILRKKPEPKPVVHSFLEDVVPAKEAAKPAPAPVRKFPRPEQPSFPSHE